MNIGLRKRCFVLNGCYTVFSFLGKILQWLGITEKKWAINATARARGGAGCRG